MSSPVLNPLLGAKSGIVIAPAGCGKTELIATTIRDSVNQRAMVLTHTNAGVDALKRRLVKMRVPANRVRVDTIAGWSLKIVESYPLLSGVTSIDIDNINWQELYKTAERLFDRPHLRKIITKSFDVLYVDEYQDCTLEQHALILNLSTIVPCKLLGDPLQGIFGFNRNQKLVSFDVSFRSVFPNVGTLNTPWRWTKANEQLGSWLLLAREKLLASESIDLAEAPVRWLPLSAENARAACFSLLKNKSSSVVAIHKFPNQCHEFASKLGGSYCSMEELGSKDLRAACKKIDDNVGYKKVAAIIEIASTCFTSISTELSSAYKSLSQGRAVVVTSRSKHREMIDSFNQAGAESSISHIIRIADTMAQVPGAKLYRNELWHDFVEVMEFCNLNPSLSMVSALKTISKQKRFSRARKHSRYVSRTLLVKGLEFDHCVILDADSLTSKELYVAMTRGRLSLTILSKSSIIAPNGALGFDLACLSDDLFSVDSAQERECYQNVVGE